MMTIEKLQEANALHERIEKAKAIKALLDETGKVLKISVPGTELDASDPNLRECLADAVAAHIQKLEYDFQWL